jgi:transcriptional regulator GlxA family with amidase domain
MSEFHFFRSFKQAFGITPYRYLLNNRLEFSKSLLQKKIPVKEIATSCGFADIFSYSKAFKKTFGTSPTAYSRMTA